MRALKRLNRLVAIVLVPALLVCATAEKTFGAMVATEQVLATTAAAIEPRARINAFLDREEVRQVLERWDVDPGEAKARVAALTDAEATDLAARLDAMPAGGQVVGIIIGAILLVFFVLLITDLLGLTDVFPFIKKHR